MYLKCFWSKVNKTDSCWLWTGSIGTHGYGKYGLGKPSLAHRISWKLSGRKLIDGLTLDHICRVKHCVNPMHLEQVTAAVNTLRGNGIGAINRRKTKCLNGHVLPSRKITKSGKPCRVCRICANAKARKWYAKKKLDKNWLRRRYDIFNRSRRINKKND